MQTSKGSKTGDFETLYAEYGQRIYRFCLRLCANPVDAEELAQDVFVAAYRSLHTFQGRSSLATWLYRIAVFQWRTKRERRQPDTVPLENGYLKTSEDADPARIGLAHIELERVSGVA